MKFPQDLVAVDERRTAFEKALNIIPKEHRSKESVCSLARALLKENEPGTVRPLTELESRSINFLRMALSTGQSEERYLIQFAQNFPALADLVANFAEDIGINTRGWRIEHLRKPHPVHERARIPIPPLKVEHQAKINQALLALLALTETEIAPAIQQLRQLREVFGLRRKEIGLEAFQRHADEPEIDSVLRPEAIRIWNAVKQLARTKPTSDEHRELRSRAVFFLAEAYRYSTADLSAEDKPPIQELISSEIAAIRQICKTGDREAFSKVGPHFQKCIEVAMSLNGLGYGLRQVALCLRYVPGPVVHDDLSFGNSRSPEIDAWVAIPASLLYFLHHYASKESVADPLLKDARSQLADFCLTRLKYTKGPDGKADQPTDQSEHWRAACICALKDLRANPSGMAHRALHWCSENDPSLSIRDLAKSAYATIRHNAGLGPGESARKALISAVVWLLSGHLYSLGHEIDYDAMSDAILDMVRRTTAPQTTA